MVNITPAFAQEKLFQRVMNAEGQKFSVSVDEYSILKELTAQAEEAIDAAIVIGELYLDKNLKGCKKVHHGDIELLGTSNNLEVKTNTYYINGSNSKYAIRTRLSFSIAFNEEGEPIVIRGSSELVDKENIAKPLKCCILL